MVAQESTNRRWCNDFFLTIERWKQLRLKQGLTFQPCQGTCPSNWFITSRRYLRGQNIKIEEISLGSVVSTQYCRSKDLRLKDAWLKSNKFHPSTPSNLGTIVLKSGKARKCFYGTLEHKPHQLSSQSRDIIQGKAGLKKQQSPDLFISTSPFEMFTKKCLIQISSTSETLLNPSTLCFIAQDIFSGSPLCCWNA